MKRKTSLTMLPDDMLGEILSKVGADSHLDLGFCMATCKTLRDISKYPEVYRSLSLDGVITPPYERIPEEMKLLEECAKYGNLHATFLCGMFNYFHLKNVSLGLNQLSMSAMETHLEAMYLYGMILPTGGEFSEGSNYLTQLWRNQGMETVRPCHMNVRRVVLELSVREYREYDILLSLLVKIATGGNFEEVCNECFIQKEIYRFMEYFN